MVYKTDIRMSSSLMPFPVHLPLAGGVALKG
jgi:hypothetical protein